MTLKLMSDAFVYLAQQTIDTYIKTGKTIPVPNDLPIEMISQKAGVFVSIHLKNGDLRGCIGTFKPTQKNIALEIIRNAVAAATEDPRFPPIRPNELANLEMNVDVLSDSIPVTDITHLNPKTNGLIVSTSDGRRGLLLPDLPGVNTVFQQEEICRQKGFIGPNEPVTYQSFTVQRHL
jgi:MEMO1 family protein